MALSITITKKKDYVYIAELRGPVDHDTYQQLEDELTELIDEKTKAVFLNMSGVDYISSVGIKSVLWLKKKLEGKNATFSMVDLQPQIKKVFDAMKILPMFDIFNDMPEADKYIDQIIQEELRKNS